MSRTLYWTEQMLMLSAETAAGEYPVETVVAVSKTAAGAEQTEQAQALGARVAAQYGRRGRGDCVRRDVHR